MMTAHSNARHSSFKRSFGSYSRLESTLLQPAACSSNHRARFAPLWPFWQGADPRGDHRQKLNTKSRFSVQTAVTCSAMGWPTISMDLVLDLNTKAVSILSNVTSRYPPLADPPDTRVFRFHRRCVRAPLSRRRRCCRRRCCRRRCCCCCCLGTTRLIAAFHRVSA
jgi:hypothetical protein